MSDAGDDDEVHLMTVREFLARPVTGRGVLPNAVQDVLEDYLLNTLTILDGVQVEALGADGLAAVYAEAVGERVSQALVGVVKRWATPPPADNAAALFFPQRGTDAQGGAERAKATKKANPRTSQMNKDLEKLGFDSGARQTAFDVSLNNGTVHEEAEVEGEEWGKDAVTTAAGIARRKAKTGESMPELLAKGDGPGIIDLMTNLVREYNLRGMNREAMALTSFMTCMMEVFGSDYKSLVEYLKSYRRKYRGRGVPVDLDIALVIKGMKSNDSSALKEELAVVKKSNDALGKKLDALTSRFDSLKSSLDEIKRKGGQSGREGKIPPTYKCNKCNAIGEHWTNQCPVAKEKKESESE